MKLADVASTTIAIATMNVTVEMIVIAVMTATAVMTVIAESITDIVTNIAIATMMKKNKRRLGK